MAEGAIELQEIAGGCLAARGYLGAAGHCGIKSGGRLDLMLLYSQPAETVAAATITTNSFRAAPTYVTERHVADGHARAVIANSGNANCATGSQGMANALRMAEVAAESLGLPTDSVLVCSTGIIGHQLPMERIEAAIPELAARLSAEEPQRLAEAIMTTDTFPKMYAVAVDIGGHEVRVGGIAKGAGMICPNMATMLAFVTSDAAVSPYALKAALKWAVDRSFNCITVDGCMSTNDTVIAFANGASGAPAIEDTSGPGFEAFSAALLRVCQELAKMIARDGEGASKFVEIRVRGALTFEQARRVGRAVANYNLLKVALFGEQFNWGRVAAALGASGEGIDPKRVEFSIGGVTAWRRGEPAEYDDAAAAEALKQREIAIDIDLGLGQAEATVWTCDLTGNFIRENAAYEGPAEAER